MIHNIIDSYAIVDMQGKQYLIRPGHWYDLNLIKNTQIGDTIKINKVLIYKKKEDLQLGRPFIPKASILLQIIKHGVRKKTLVLKTKRKKKYTRIFGHRTYYTRAQWQIKTL